MPLSLDTKRPMLEEPPWAKGYQITRKIGGGSPLIVHTLAEFTIRCRILVSVSVAIEFMVKRYTFCTSIK